MESFRVASTSPIMVDLFIDDVVLTTEQTAAKHAKAKGEAVGNASDTAKKRKDTTKPCGSCKHLAEPHEPFCRYHLNVEEYVYTRLDGKRQRYACHLHDKKFPLYCKMVKACEGMYQKGRERGEPILWNDENAPPNKKAKQPPNKKAKQ